MSRAGVSQSWDQEMAIYDLISILLRKRGAPWLLDAMESIVMEGADGARIRGLGAESIRSETIANILARAALDIRNTR